MGFFSKAIQMVTSCLSVCAGGLTENDFIFAAKVDQIDTKDLSRRNRTWF